MKEQGKVLGIAEGSPASGTQAGGAERKDGQGRTDSGHRGASVTSADGAPSALLCPSQGDTPVPARGVPENTQQGGGFSLSQDTEPSARPRVICTPPVWDLQRAGKNRSTNACKGMEKRARKNP